MNLTFSVGDILSVITILFVVVGSHLRLENRLTKIETRDEERSKANEKNESEQSQWRSQIDAKLTQFNERLMTMDNRMHSQEQGMIRIEQRLKDVEGAR